VYPWLIKHLATIAALAVNLVTIGGFCATVRGDLARADQRIKAIEELKTEETKWRVAQAEKRLDAHDASFLRISEKLDKISGTLERIDQRTSGGK
jgi:hypothetical protein